MAPIGKWRNRFIADRIEGLYDEIAHRGVEDRVRFQGGNFFEDPLPKVDVIVMGHILHDWDLAKKKVLLGKAFDALSKGGAVVVYDAIIDDDRRENAFGLMMSLNMLIETAGGFDYTGEDCLAWMREVGFSKPRIEPLVGPESMLLLHGSASKADLRPYAVRRRQVELSSPSRYQRSAISKS
jgi:hypothetical protein